MAKSVADKQPWLKFYPSDWRSEPTLRVCSLAARGLWMEMLCLMHEAQPCGSLLVNGRQVTPRQLAALATSSLKEVEAVLAELEEAGVFSRDPDGTIYSRRMRDDVERSNRAKANGSNGGNPALKGRAGNQDKPLDKGSVNQTDIQEDNRQLKQEDNQEDKPPDKPSRSASEGARTIATQRPEARKNRDSSASAEPEPAATPGLERRCRDAVGEEPCLCDPNFGPILVLLDEPGVTEADVLAGIAAGLAKAEPGFRFRHWRQFANWIRGAAKDRLGASPRQAAAANPNRPTIEIRDNPVAESRVVELIEIWERTGAWPERWSPPPGEMFCEIPQRLWPERLRSEPVH